MGATHMVFENRMLNVFFIKNIKTGKILDYIEAKTEKKIKLMAKSQNFELSNEKGVVIKPLLSIFEPLS